MLSVQNQNDFFHEIQTYTTLACSKKAKTKASRNVQFQSKLTHTVGQSEHPQAPLIKGMPWGTCPHRKKHQSLVLGRRAGMAGWGTGGMRKERSLGSIASGRAGVFVLGLFDSFVIKIKEGVSSLPMDGPSKSSTAHSDPQSRHHSNHLCSWLSLDPRVPSGPWEGGEGHGLGGGDCNK